MIMTVEELRRFVETDESDECLAAKLAGIEQQIRGYTHNDFHVVGTGLIMDVVGGVFSSDAILPYEEGDTVQIIGSDKNDGLYTVKDIDDQENTFTVNERVRDEIDVYVTQVSYPPDVKMGVTNMLVWEMENRTKAGIQSETISRHTVNYINLDEWNSAMGYPASLVQFLRPYMRGRFGRGIGK